MPLPAFNQSSVRTASEALNAITIYFDQRADPRFSREFKILAELLATASTHIEDHHK